MKPPFPPVFTVSPDGETVTITTDCSPVSQPHTAVVALRDLELVVNRARASQLGADVFGRL